MINPDGIWTMIGFSIYVFEGIGVIMPIMQACEYPEKFDTILVSAVICLTVVYCIFSFICNLAWG
jgi:proton-coupled amino acid transporter